MCTEHLVDGRGHLPSTPRPSLGTKTAHLAGRAPDHVHVPGMLDGAGSGIRGGTAGHPFMGISHGDMHSQGQICAPFGAHSWVLACTKRAHGALAAHAFEPLPHEPCIVLCACDTLASRYALHRGCMSSQDGAAGLLNGRPGIWATPPLQWTRSFLVDLPWPGGHRGVVFTSMRRSKCGQRTSYCPSAAWPRWGRNPKPPHLSNGLVCNFMRHFIGPTSHGSVTYGPGARN
mmetsp:Transcript_76049/g.126742  ORF Transcript_76049/g.126742 Transcript_76049/m.126742 type:complete len:231 (-) Transcript_76049:638-1330(-)